MNALKYLILSILGVLIASAAFAWLVLFLGAKEGFYAGLAAGLLAIVGVVSGFIWLVKRSEKQGGKKSPAACFMVSSIVFGVIVLFLAFANFILYEVEMEFSGSTELSAAQKLSYYEEILNREDVIDLDALDNRQLAGITFYYEKETDPSAQLEWITQYVRENKRRLEKELGGATDAEFSVVLYSGGMEIPVRETTQEEYSGFYQQNDQSIHIPLPVNETVFAHEYIHHLFFSIADERRIGATKTPLWFAEGVATHLSERDQQIYPTYGSETEYIEFEKLKTYSGWENHLKEPYDPYFQSRGFLQYLSGKEGDDVIPEIFSELKRKSFEESFQSATGRSVEDYEQEFFDDFRELPILFEQASLLEIQNKDFQESLEIFYKIANIAPNMELVNHRIAGVQMKMGNYKEALNFQQQEFELTKAGKENLSASHLNFASNIMFSDITKAVEAAQTAVKVSKTPEELKWAQNVLNELKALKQEADKGHPLKGYFDILNGKYAVNTGVNNQREKITFINVVLENHPQDQSAGRTALVELKQQLEHDLAVGNY